MNDEPNVRLIYSHPKSDCGHNDMDFVFHPFLLNMALLCITDVGVVECDFIPLGLEFLAELFALLPGEAIDDS